MFKKIFHNSSFFFLALLSMGISFCFTFELTNLSSLFRFLGASSHDLPFLWLAPPLTGLIVQPIIGQISDDTTTRFGKRRPFIVGWGILAAISFCILPTIHSFLFVVLAIWIIDSALNGTLEGLRALTCDLALSDTDRSKAFAIQAFLSGIGAALGTSLPYFLHKLLSYLHIEWTSGPVALNIQLSYFVCGLILISVVIYTMRHVKEKPNKYLSLYKKKKQAKPLGKRIKKIALELYTNMRKSTHHFKTICCIHAIGWMGIFIFWLHFITTLAQNKYGISPLGNALDPEYAARLQQATLDSATYLSVYQYVSILYGLFLFFLSNRFNLILLHAAGLAIGGAGMAMLSFTHSDVGIMSCMICIGIMWGSILVLPYSIVMKHIPKGKRGIYLGLFNISITAPQILVSLLLPFIFKYLLHSNATYLMLLAGIFLIISAVFWVYQTNLMSYKRTKLVEVDALS